MNTTPRIIQSFTLIAAFSTFAACGTGEDLASFGTTARPIPNEIDPTLPPGDDDDDVSPPPAPADLCPQDTPKKTVEWPYELDNTRAYVPFLVFDYMAGETLRFSTCGNHTGDTYLRLVDLYSGQEVARSNDDCPGGGTGSTIVYTVPSTQMYLELRGDCNGPVECSATITYQRSHDTNGYMSSRNGGLPARHAEMNDLPPTTFVGIGDPNDLLDGESFDCSLGHSDHIQGVARRYTRDEIDLVFSADTQHGGRSGKLWGIDMAGQDHRQWQFWDTQSGPVNTVVTEFDVPAPSWWEWHADHLGGINPSGRLIVVGQEKESSEDGRAHIVDIDDCGRFRSLATIEVDLSVGSATMHRLPSKHMRNSDPRPWAIPYFSRLADGTRVRLDGAGVVVAHDTNSHEAFFYLLPADDTGYADIMGSPGSAWRYWGSVPGIQQQNGSYGMQNVQLVIDDTARMFLLGAGNDSNGTTELFEIFLDGQTAHGTTCHDTLCAVRVNRNSDYVEVIPHNFKAGVGFYPYPRRPWPVTETTEKDPLFVHVTNYCPSGGQMYFTEYHNDL